MIIKENFPMLKKKSVFLLDEDTHRGHIYYSTNILLYLSKEECCLCHILSPKFNKLFFNRGSKL